MLPLLLLASLWATCLTALATVSCGEHDACSTDQASLLSYRAPATHQFARTDDGATIVSETDVQLSDAEWKNLHEEHFYSLDTDGSGELSAEEILIGFFSGEKIDHEKQREGSMNVSASSLKLSEREVASLIQRADLDGSGMLSLKELLLAFPSGAPASAASLGQEVPTLSMSDALPKCTKEINVDEMVSNGCSKWGKIGERNCKWHDIGCHVEIFGTILYDCVRSVSKTVAKTFEECLSEVLDEVKSKIPDDLHKAVELIMDCGIDADKCKDKLLGSLQQLGDIIADWVSDNFDKLGDGLAAEFNKVKAHAAAAANTLEGAWNEVQGTFNEVGNFVSGATSLAADIVQQYGIDDFCSPEDSGRLGFSVTDCGAWDAVKKIFEDLTKIEENFNSAVDKLKSCIERKYNKLPTPFLQVNTQQVCVPEEFRAPLNGMIATVRYSMAGLGGVGASFVASIKTITTKLTDITKNHFSLLQDRGLVASSSELGGVECDANFGMIVAELAFALVSRHQGSPGASTTGNAVAFIIQVRFMCIGGFFYPHLSFNFGMDWDILKKPFKPQSKSVVMALGWGPVANDKAISEGFLVKASGKTPKGWGGGIAVDLKPVLSGNSPALKLFGSFTKPLAGSPATLEETVSSVAKIAEALTPSELQQLHQSALVAKADEAAVVAQDIDIVPSFLVGYVMNVCVTCLFIGPKGPVVPSNNEPGHFIHWVASCSQCNRDLCPGGQPFKPYYRTSTPLSEWGCDKLDASPLTTWEDGHLFVVQKAKLHYVGTCTQCGNHLDLCSNLWKNEAGLENQAEFQTASDLNTWGCANVGSSPTIVRDATTHKIFVVEF
ncbi:ADS3 [Symbiodinium sp. CCMP2592]|nr:ADS3 [Symbiodinium sp. CCMP2592]